MTFNFDLTLCIYITICGFQRHGTTGLFNDFKEYAHKRYNEKNVCDRFQYLFVHLKQICLKDFHIVNTDIKMAETTASSQQFSLALVPYDEGLLPEFHKTQRAFQFGNHELKIHQNWQSSGVAAVVWDAAIVMCEYLLSHQDIIEKKNVLELGAGTGLVGILAAKLGAGVVVTDRKNALENLQENVNLNLDSQDSTQNKGQTNAVAISVKELNWGENLDEFQRNDFDIILGADIIYIEETFPLLLRTFESLSSTKTKIFISCRIRYGRDKRFLKMLSDKFQLTQMYYDTSRDIYVYSASKS